MPNGNASSSRVGLIVGGSVLESDSRLVPAVVVTGPLRTPLAQVKNSSSVDLAWLKAGVRRNWRC